MGCGLFGLPYIVTLLHNLPNKLVPADEVGGALEVAAVEVEVAAAEGGGGDAEDGVGGFLAKTKEVRGLIDVLEMHAGGVVGLRRGVGFGTYILGTGRSSTST